MLLADSEFEIMNNLIGSMSNETAASIKSKIDCFFHPKVSLFIPASGQCEYAVTPSHTHPAYSFIYYFQPVDELIVEDRSISYDLVNGKCLFALSPNIPHQEIMVDHFQSYIAIMIDEKLFNSIYYANSDSLPLYRGEVFVPHPELLGVLRCFMLEANKYQNENKSLLDHLAQVIVHLVVRSIASSNYQTVKLYDRFEVDRAIAYMNSHYSEKITTEMLSELVSRSAGHFSKIFKSVTGMTPMDFLQMLRLQKARMLLLNSTKNMTEIALECGFNTSSYFSSCFLLKYKSTPSAFRLTFTKNL